MPRLASLDQLGGLPGAHPVNPRRTPQARIVSCLAASAWPPLILTLFWWPPRNWFAGVDTDWRLVLFAIGLIAAPFGLWLLERAFARTDKTWTRLGVVGRFVLFGGLLAAAVQVLVAVIMLLLSAVASQTVLQGVGAIETSLLIFGVAGLPVAVIVGLSYALWGGLCVAFIAFRRAPERVRPRMGLMTEA